MNLSTDKEVHTANYYVNYNVINKNDENIKAIIDRWQEYLKAEDQIGYNNEYWTSDNQVCPSCIMRLIPLNNFKKGGTQNTVIGVLPVEENIWELTSLFSYNQGGMVQPHFVLKIYVKKIESEYKFINKVDYVKQKLLSSKVGNLTYYYDCDHDFNEKKAIQLNEFNNYLSNFFDTPAIDFDYFVCSSVRDISKLKGFEFEPSMYVPNQTGAIVDNINKIIYAGNSSEYYPHEVVHLYTKELFNYSYHTWIDEGLATMLGGSREKDLKWHLLELKEFLEDNEEFELNDISKLNTIPNGKYTTEFRYVIGGLVVKEIYDLEGIDGVREALQYGNKDEDFYRLLKEKFDVSKGNFGEFIRDKLRTI